jgi:hypothetical protein
VLDKARFAAPGGALQQDRKATGKGGPKDLHFIADRQIEWLAFDSILLNG